MQGGQEAIQALIDLLARLPGLGPRSARRAVLYLLKRRDQTLRPLVQALDRVAREARTCTVCGNIGTDEICGICLSDKRRIGQICVVEDVADLWAMERAGVYGGRYHVLGGMLSALDAVGPEDLRIPRLEQRLAEEDVTEVILALTATVEGQTTAHYIADRVEAAGIKVTTLAQGVPIGGELDYLDDGTIGAALSARKGV